MYLKNKKNVFNKEDADEKQNNHKLKHELHRKLLETIANQIDFNSKNDYKFIDKENSVIAKIDELDIDADEFKDLMKLHEFNKNSLLKSIEYFKEFDDVNYSDDSDNSAITSFLDAMKFNRDRFN